MVMPRSFSRSMESRTCPTAFLASMVPVRDRRRSARVDLAGSMWATMEKLRIRSMAIVFRISRGELRCVGGKAGASAHDGAVLEDGSGADLGARGDANARAHDAVAEDRSEPDRHAVPETGALHHRSRSHLAASTENGRGAHAGIITEPAGRAHHPGRQGLHAGAEARVGGDRAPIAGRSHEAEIGSDMAGEQVEMGLPVLGRAPAGDPVAVAGAAAER